MVLKYINIKNISKRDNRTIKAKKNIVASIILKGIDTIIYLLLVPITLGYLNKYEYGIWLTLNSILMWINSFDIGLGNGMRNRLAEAIAESNNNLARIYVSTTFFMLIILMGFLILGGAVCESFVNWYDILSTTPDLVSRLNEIVYVTFVIFCLNFIFKIIGNIYLAMQLPAVNNLMVVGGHILSLILIFILTKTTSGSLFYVAIVYSVSPLLIYLVAYPITFYKIYPHLLPSISFFKYSYLRNLFNIGLQFFLLQLSAIFLFAFANLLISHMLGPENVTSYNIAYRYFSLVPMAMNLILTPMWSATTEAYVNGDLSWIIHTMKIIRKILLIAIIVLVIMVVVSKFVYCIWIGTDVEISLSLSLMMALYVGILTYSLSYSQFLNGLGKLRVQMLNTTIVAIISLPLCYFLGKIEGLVGILAGMCMLNTSGLVLNYIQFNLIVHKRATGIWYK